MTRGIVEHPLGLVVDCDVATGIPAIEAARPATHALVLVRVFTEPIGVLNMVLPAGGLRPRDLAQAICDDLGERLRERVEESGLTWREQLPIDGIRPPRTPRFLEGRVHALTTGPSITVAVCTRDRPDGLARLLATLRDQEYARMRVLVVDNAPSDRRTRQLVSALSREQDIEYILEPRPGLSWARNRAIEEIDTEVIAWVDDDELCDPWWSTEIARGFVEVSGADAVTGIVIPAELRTQSQVWFERYFGVSRGRGFDRAVLSAATLGSQSPLYPLPPFGIGANMAFRRDALERIGRFDCALGAGTPALAGEDTAALTALLLAGGTIVYQPTAVVHHRHRADYPELRALMGGYGRGLGAYYASMLVRQPKCGLELLRLSRQAARDQVSSRGQRLRGLDKEFPRDLLRANRVGLLQGPFMYALARRRARRVTCATGDGR
jgi:glycosyltransferase involved in cell wall biosynthesis